VLTIVACAFLSRCANFSCSVSSWNSPNRRLLETRLDGSSNHFIYISFLIIVSLSTITLGPVRRAFLLKLTNWELTLLLFFFSVKLAGTNWEFSQGGDTRGPRLRIHRRIAPVDRPRNASSPSISIFPGVLLFVWSGFRAEEAVESRTSFWVLGKDLLTGRLNSSDSCNFFVFLWSCSPLKHEGSVDWNLTNFWTTKILPLHKDSWGYSCSSGTLDQPKAGRLSNQRCTKPNYYNVSRILNRKNNSASYQALIFQMLLPLMLLGWSSYSISLSACNR
jgi:hypothetical protein